MVRLLMIKLNQGLSNVGGLRWRSINKFRIKRAETANESNCNPFLHYPPHNYKIHYFIDRLQHQGH